ncbi:unnamed protein product [Onchocerca flexuosa]|uniref:Uncharacterized protein n=1 Tax=Onchocerca flexuosa TaxID=387005 RepID=A0A183HID2_9BILA|nr:unnamed protein product [Onchocerca flexuosa]
MKKEIPSTTDADNITPPVISSYLLPTSSQNVEKTIIKGSEEYITPIITSNYIPVVCVAAETAGTSSNGSRRDGISITSDIDAEEVILSTPACQVLEIIIKKQLFKNAATESENDLIRMYFAGKIPPGRGKEAQEILERAVRLAVTRVKTSGLTEELYSFLNNNREMAISLMIDAMKYRKKEFLPEFWS